jgi:protein-tyrosine kinase
MKSDESDIGILLAPVWARKWLILVVAILAAAGAYAHYQGRPGVYRSSTTLFFGKETVDALLSGSQSGGGTTDRQLSNQATLIASRRMGQLVAKKLKTNASPEAFTSLISVTPQEGRDFLTITATASNPTFAAKLANTFAEVYIETSLTDYRKDLDDAIAGGKLNLSRIQGSSREARADRRTLQQRIDELRSLRSLAEPRAQQIDVARPSGLSLSPNPQRYAIFAFFLGLVAASLAVIGLSRLQIGRFDSLEAVESATDFPVLTALPHVRGSALAPSAPLPPELREPLRRLDTTLTLMDASPNGNRSRAPAAPGGEGINAAGWAASDRPGTSRSRKTILITSAEHGVGKSTLVRTLAMVQHEAGRRVVVVDSDMRRPVQERLLNVKRAPGLADVLSRDTDLSQALQQAAPPEGRVPRDAAGAATLTEQPPADGIAVLSAGAPPPNPPALMVGPELGRVIDRLSADFDSVLIDSPPPLAVSDVLPLLSRVDGIILVVRINESTTRSLMRLLQLLERMPNAPVLGIVANDVPSDEIAMSGYFT